MQGIVEMAVANKVDAIHPGYGLLSERTDFAQACKDNGVTFVGPTPQNLQTFGNFLFFFVFSIHKYIYIYTGWAQRET